ncbi:MAG: hypothetical protein FRX49_05447 [Trebouxia sp. A1-2]|nr:MAG: hypothetical protein FRX49_05447 [Trebouxia sp. A1-2]
MQQDSPDAIAGHANGTKLVMLSYDPELGRPLMPRPPENTKYSSIPDKLLEYPDVVQVAVPLAGSISSKAPE